MIGLSRCSLHYQRANRDDDELRLALIRLAKQYGRYGYRKIAELLRIEGWKVNHKKVDGIWPEEGCNGTIGAGAFATKTMPSCGCDLLIKRCVEHRFRKGRLKLIRIYPGFLWKTEITSASTASCGAKC